MNILIVDDNRDDRTVLRYMVSKNGHQSIEAADGLDGLKKARSSRPDLIISDALMPVMDGFQFLRQVKQDPDLRTIPFIFYSSSYKDYQDVRLAVSLGADAYIIKPVEPVELWRKIEDLLKAGKTAANPPVPLIREDAEYLKRYSEVVATKLEEKVRELELTLEGRKRAEEALRESERKYRRIVDTASEGIVMLGPDAMTTFVNARMADLLGYRIEDMIGQPLTAFMFDEDASDHLRTMEAHRLGKTDQYERRFRCRDGRAVWTLVSAVPVFDGENKFSGSFGMFTDISTRKKAEEDLEKNERFLNNIVENIPNTIFVKDAETLRFVRFNKAGEQLLGYSRDELLGKSDYDLFPKEIADFFTAKDREVLGGKLLVDIPEESVRTKDKAERILHTKKIPILDETGKPQYLVGISEDITERRRAEESIRKLSQAVEQSPVSIIITNASGTIEFVNSKFTEATGYSRAEALGRNPRMLKSGETPAEEYRRLWKTISSGGVWSGEFHNRKKNGELFWEQATIAPIRNADNVITHYVAVKEDITGRKKLEEQLRQAQKMEAIGTLAGGVAHDFNNILTAIIGYGTLVKMKMKHDDPQHHLLDQLLLSSERAANLTRGLLAFSRKQVLNPKPVDLNDIVKSVERLLRRLIGEDVELAITLADTNLIVMADAGQIEQVLMNLATNARDAMPEGGALSLTTEDIDLKEGFIGTHGSGRPRKYARITVIDSGTGMDEQTREKIFDPFFTTKEAGKGTGLGLAIVYGIVKQHDGIINVESEAGKGTAFKVYLPLIATTTEQAPAETLPPPRGGTETILLAEDDQDVRNLTKHVLQDFGYRVIAAQDGQEAIDRYTAQADDIDLLILDVIMPKKSGREVYDAVKAVRRDANVLFVSGYTADVLHKKGMFEEGIQFIAKPVSPSVLLEKIREVLDKHPSG